MRTSTPVYRTPVVHTALGDVIGDYLEGMQRYHGIPYGGPCEGARRFLPPTPAEPWTGVRDCTRNGAIAVQPACSVCASPIYGRYFSGGHPERFGVETELQSENCLVLHVATPCADAKRRPVLVYFHGGGFAVGSGSIVLGANRFAIEENLVLVGVNHRLNAFGYLYLGEEERYRSSGMAGLLDLVLALRWVRDNITAFGGDPEKVTIMGESGGGMKVNALLQMPEARGLFRQAIVESGSFPSLADGRAEAARITWEIQKELGLAGQAVSRLAEVPAERLMRASLPYMMRLRPIADDLHWKALQEPSFAPAAMDTSIPMMIGSSEDECAIDWKPVEITDATLAAALCREDLRPPMANAARHDTEDDMRRAVEVFRAHNRKGDSAEHLFWKIHSYLGYAGGGAYEQALARVHAGGAPVYAYLNAFNAPHHTDPTRRYSWHTFDLPLQLRIVPHPECEEVSRAMGAAWGAFVRTGNPSTAQLPWPAFTPEAQQTLLFDDECRVEESPFKALRQAGITI